jgi:hypothetical protein
MALFAAEHRFGPTVSVFLSFCAENPAAFLQISSRIIKKGNQRTSLPSNDDQHGMVGPKQARSEGGLWKNLRDQ